MRWRMASLAVVLLLFANTALAAANCVRMDALKSRLAAKPAQQSLGAYLENSVVHRQVLQGQNECSPAVGLNAPTAKASPESPPHHKEHLAKQAGECVFCLSGNALLVSQNTVDFIRLNDQGALLAFEAFIIPAQPHHRTASPRAPPVI